MITTYFDQTQFKAKPIGGQVATMQFTQETLSINDFVNKVSTGQTFLLASQLKDNIRKTVNWQSQQLFAADIDQDNLDLLAILDLCDNFCVLPFCIYESFSSMPTNRKWRILWASKEPIKDPKVCLAILREIKAHFNSDPAIVDLARLLYGTTADKIAHIDAISTFSLADFIFTASEPQMQPKSSCMPATFSGMPETQVDNSFKHAILPKAKALLTNPRIPLDRYNRIYKATLLLIGSEVFTKVEIRHLIRNNTKAGIWADYDRTPEDIDKIVSYLFTWASQNFGKK